MNPNAEWDREKGFLIEDAFAGEEEFRMPEPFGMNRLVKVEHEEVVTLPRYLGQYGLRKASFKIALDENLLNALKVIDRLGLRSCLLYTSREIADRFPKRPGVQIGEVNLEVQNWTVYHPLYSERKVVDNVSIKVHKGEVVGISGLMGAGRTEPVSYTHLEQYDGVSERKKHGYPGCLLSELPGAEPSAAGAERGNLRQ